MTTSDQAAQPLTTEELARAKDFAESITLGDRHGAQSAHSMTINTAAANIMNLARCYLAQAAKPPTVQLDKEKLAEIVYNCPAAVTQRQAGKIADALISALPGLTPAHPVTTGPDADAVKLAQKLKALAAKAAKGEWGVEDPMAPETLSVVANPKAQVYDWMFICHLTMPDENDHDFTHAQVRDNAAYIAAANPDAIALLAREVLRLHAAPGAGWRELNLLACARNLVDSAHNGNLYTLEYNALKDAVEAYDVTEPPAPASEGAA